MTNMKRLVGVACCFLAICYPGRHEAAAHGIPLPVVVDTDMALDDIRALTMLLNSPTTRIALIVTSDGGDHPRAGAEHVIALLRYFGREDVAVAEGRALDAPPPPWRAWIGELPFPETSTGKGASTEIRPAVEALAATLSSMNEEFIYLCLGPLTNLADVLRTHPELREKIPMLLYFGAHPELAEPGWNTKRDPDAARFVYQTGIEIHDMNLPNARFPVFDPALHEAVGKLGTPAARLLAAIHDIPPVMRLLKANHFRVWDELAVLYLNDPSPFRFTPSPTHAHVTSLSDIETDEIRPAYLALLGHPGDAHLDPREAVVLKEFPQDVSLFQNDVAPLVPDIIGVHGLEEWKACLLTNELHRHLGAYSLVGAKMGVRAREILRAPFDTLRVVSHAGAKPPLSCLNDGIQAATGASLGRGAIEISPDQYEPAAVFYHGTTRLKLKLKEEYRREIQAGIQAALKEFGGTNAAYFDRIRSLSLRYWRDWKREDLFEEKEVP